MLRRRFPAFSSGWEERGAERGRSGIACSSRPMTRRCSKRRGLSRSGNAGYVEPIEPPRRPMHIMAQQIMALALQERGIGRSDWFRWIAGVQGFQKTSDAERSALVEWMLAEDILFDDSGILWFGKKGEAKYGRKNFLEIMSVFLSPPVISVLHGRQELGYVDEMTFLGTTKGPRVLLLGGRAWRVTHVDWQRRVAFVEATEDKGRSRWKGDVQPLWLQGDAIHQGGAGIRRCEAGLVEPGWKADGATTGWLSLDRARADGPGSEPGQHSEVVDVRRISSQFDAHPEARGAGSDARFGLTICAEI